MKNGIYEATFTTNQGTLGVAAVIIKNGAFVGADGLQFYRGEIDQIEDNVRVIMEVSRHNFVTASAFGDAPMFTLTWRGKATSETAFKLGCEPEGINLTIYVAGQLLKEFA